MKFALGLPLHLITGQNSTLHSSSSFLLTCPLNLGDESDPFSYLPIAPISLISKAMGTIITKQLLMFLETNNLFLISSTTFEKPGLLAIFLLMLSMSMSCPKISILLRNYAYLFAALFRIRSKLEIKWL